MSRLAKVALAFPRAAVMLGLVLTAVLAAGIPRLELRTGGDALRPDGDPLVVQTERDRIRFLDPRQAIVLLGSRDGGPAVASPAGLRFLARVDAELRQLPSVRGSGVLSLAGLARPVREGGVLAVRARLDENEVPDDPDRFAALLAELRGLRLTDGLLLAPDGRLAALYAPVAEDRSVAEAVADLEAWAGRYTDAPFTVELTGPEKAEATLGTMVLRDLVVLVPVMLIVIAAVLFAIFRNLGGVIVPMVESLVVLLWTFGAMGWLGIPVTLVTTILPVVLMAMVITDEIHLMERSHAYRAGGECRSHREAMERALDEVGRPIVLTSLTTALGFTAFLSAGMTPVQQFGALSAAGILIAMVLTFVWLPPLIIMLPEAWFHGRSGGRRWRAGLGLGRWAARRPALSFGLGALIVVAAATGLPQLRVQDSWVGNFSSADPLVRAERRFNASFWGSYRFDVTLEGSRELFYTPNGVALMERVEAIATTAPNTSAALSYLAPLGEIAAALDFRDRLSARTPIEIADLATIAEMSENRLLLRQLVTDDGEAARARLFVRNADYDRATALRAYLDEHVPALAEEFGVRFHYGGDLAAALATVGAIVSNQLRSIAWALVTVGALLALVVGVGGMVVCIVPAAAAVIVVLGAMGHAGVPLGIATSMFASLTVGVGVDFGIHLLHQYRFERAGGRSSADAVAATVEKVGTAVGWNCLVLAGGFLVLTLSTLRPNHSLGVLLASAMAVSCGGAMMFSPRLLRSFAMLLVALPLVLVAEVAAADPSPPGAPSAAQKATRSPAATGTATATGRATDACAKPEDPAAAALMAALETRFRSHPLVTRSQIGTIYGEQHPLHAHFKGEPYEKTLWGLFDGNAEVTHLLHVFSAPGRLAGTTLLIHDFADPAKPDAMWIYLRSFDSFTKVDARSERTMVPGTALTYEDSRGFIPRDKYRFSFTRVDDVTAGKGEKLVLGCPASKVIRENLGYESIVVLVDTTGHLVRKILYRDLGGKKLKSYEVVDTTKLDGELMPAAVRMQHFADGFVTTINYEHWRPNVPPPSAVYTPEVTKEKFLPRLQRLLDEAGIGGKLRTEIAEAEKRIAEYEKRVRERPEQTPAGEQP